MVQATEERHDDVSRATDSGQASKQAVAQALAARAA